VKAYLVAQSAPLFPFRRSPASFVLGDETVGARLRRQLLSARFEIIEARADQIELDGPGCVLHDNLVLADATVASLVSQVRGATRTVQWSVDASLMQTVRADGRAPMISPLPVWVFGAKRELEASTQLLETRPLFELPVGFPPKVFGLVNTRVPALDQFAVAIERWPELLNASTLVARELGAKLYSFFSKVLPAPVLRWALGSPRLVGLFNRKGRGCRVHPSAVLEGCVLGDDVEIGAHAYLRGAIIGSRTVIREGCSVQGAVLGHDSYVMRCDVANAYVGASTVVATGMLLNTLLGNETFIGGGVGFADYLNASRDVELRLPTGAQSSGQRFLGSSVGDNCFIGAGLLFSPGEAIPSGSSILNPQLINRVPPEFDQVFAASRSTLTRIPASFVKGTS